MASAYASSQPLIVATSSSSSSCSSSSFGSSSTSCAAVIDPVTGSVLPSLRTGAGIGLASLCRYPSRSKLQGVLSGGAGGGGGSVDVYYGHGTGGGSGSGAAPKRGDENIYLIAHRHSAAATAAGSTTTMTNATIGQRWRTKPPEPVTSNVCISPCGTFVMVGTKSGRCYVWNVLGTAPSSSRGGGGGSSSSSSGPSSSGGGELLRIFTAHNRPVTCLAFSSDGSLVVTAGQDGIVNAFALLDIVSSLSSSSFGDDHDADGSRPASHTGGAVVDDSSIRPVRTFSEHHLPVQDVAALPSNRLVSVSSDRQLILMELCSGVTIARVALPASIRCVAADGSGRRVYAGGDDGVVYCVDLDVLAVKETAESATVVSIGGDDRNATAGGGSSVGRSQKFGELSLSGSRLGETILGIPSASRAPDAAASGRGGAGSSSGGGGGASKSGISELIGHSRPVTALAVVDSEQHQWTGATETLVVSGSDDGTLRVWDMRTRACTRVIRPWGGNSGAASTSSTSSHSSSASSCPISSILVVPRETDRAASSSAASFGPFGMGVASNSRGRGAGAADAALDLFRPLQRFRNDKPNRDVVPILKATRNTSLVRRWEGEETNTTGGVQQHGVQKRPRTSIGKTPSWDVDERKPGDDAGKDDDGFLAMESGIPVPGKDETITASSDKETAALRKELEEARATIKRWEKVNNKMAAKLQKVMSGAQG